MMRGSKAAIHIRDGSQPKFVPHQNLEQDFRRRDCKTTRLRQAMRLTARIRKPSAAAASWFRKRSETAGLFPQPAFRRPLKADGVLLFH
jgi:hypothetical protein